MAKQNSNQKKQSGVARANRLYPAVALYDNLKLRILLPVVIAMMIILGAGLFVLYWQDRQDIDAEVRASVNGVEKVFNNQLDEDALLMAGFLQFLIENEKLQQAWLARDRETLLELAMPTFERINAEDRVTHFYFIDTDQTCFVRIHRPSHYGDTITRETMKQAKETGKTAYGIELGKYGHFSLRVVQPWFVDGKLVGYMELGEEIEHITPKLAEILGVDVAFAIDKKFLNQSMWEKGLKILGHTGDWNQLTNYVIIDKTFSTMPPALLSLIDSGQNEDWPVTVSDPETATLYRGEILPLKDAGNQRVGDLVVFKDITAQTAALRDMAFLMLIVGTLVGTGLFAVCYIYITSIRKTSKQLIDTAHEAGKAEIATSVLHNVGNVLNNVNVSAGLIQDQVLSSSSNNLTKAVEIMKQHLGEIGDYVTQDEHGKHLPQFLIDVSQQISSEEELILDEVHSLIKNIDHIKAVVASQQKNAKRATGLLEPFSLVELVEDAIEIHTASMGRHFVNVTLNYDHIENIISDKQLLLQIVVNLITNAKNACVESGHETHQILIRLHRKGTDRVAIEVQDNGMGISPENLTKIFNHGFTTRKDGHGFGLHSSALAVQELGGSLTASSDGPGLGATFILEIPYEEAGALLCTN